MEQINIAKILKNYPEGTKLYSPLCGSIMLSTIQPFKDTSYTIYADNGKGVSFGFTSYGKYFNAEDAECMLFPSKEMRDWKKLRWQKGDVLANSDDTRHVIFEKFCDDTYTNFCGRYYSNKAEEGCYIECLPALFTMDFSRVRGTSYIHDLEKAYHGKFNKETLEIEPDEEGCPFKPFDKVIVRTYYSKWHIDFFSHYMKNNNCYVTTSGYYDKCLPYNEETAKLIGTSENFNNV